MGVKPQEDVKLATLADKIRELHRLRLKEGDLITEKNRRQIAFDAENAELYQQLSDTRAALAALESEIRADAVAEFEATGEKSPAPGVNIKEITSYEYSPAEALAWVKAHGLDALVIPESLNQKAFEKDVCRSDLRPEFVTVIKTPRAEIATDLRNAVGEVS